MNVLENASNDVIGGHDIVATWSGVTRDTSIELDPLTTEDLGREGMLDSERISITETFIDQFHADVFRYAYWLTGCRQSAEDISQDVFAKAFRGVHRLRDPQAAKGWLMTITRNEYARWCKKLPPKPYGGESNLCQELMSEEQTQSEENLEWVQKGLEELPHEFRLVVLMYYFEGLSYAEIAENLSVPIGTVMSRLSRGRLHLKRALEQLVEPKRSQAKWNGEQNGK